MIKLEEMQRIFEGFWKFIGGPLLNALILAFIVLVLGGSSLVDGISLTIKETENLYARIKGLDDPLGIKAVIPVVFWFVVISAVYLLHSLCLALASVMPLQISINSTVCTLRASDPRTLATVWRVVRSPEGVVELVNLINGNMRLGEKSVEEASPNLRGAQSKANYWHRAFLMAQFYFLVVLLAGPLLASLAQVRPSTWTYILLLIFMAIGALAALRYWEWCYWYSSARVRSIADFYQSDPSRRIEGKDQERAALELKIRQQVRQLSNDRFWMIHFKPLLWTSLIWRNLFQRGWWNDPRHLPFDEHAATEKKAGKDESHRVD